jgi:ABC-type glycerol-3-phosphate transport system permease component
VGGFFTGGVLILNLIIWTITTAFYKQQSIVTNEQGIHNDLWGWTCSPAAQLLQPVFDEQVNFNTYCDVQAVSFYIGLVQIGAVIFTIVLYGFALKRLQSKKKIWKSLTARQSSG